MKVIILTALAFFVTTAYGSTSVVVDHRCLVAGGTKPIHLEWRVFTEPASKWSSAYVRYKGSKTIIPLVLRSQEATAKPTDQPWEFTTTWVEIVGGQFTGEYKVVTQGTSIYSFAYKNYGSGKELAFLQDHDAYEESGCVWSGP